MRSAVQDAEKIVNYLDMVAFSNRDVFFLQKGQRRSIPAQIVPTRETNLPYRTLAFQHRPPILSGDIVLQVVSLQYRFPVTLEEKEDKHYAFKIPTTLRVHDLRRCPRLPMENFDVHPVELIPIEDGEPRTEDLARGTMKNISATGVALNFMSRFHRIKRGDVVQIHTHFFGRKINLNAEVVGLSDQLARCAFTDMDSSLQKQLLEEIWSHLNDRIGSFSEDIKTAYFEALEREKRTRESLIKLDLKASFLELINPIIESVSTVFEEVFDINPTRKDVKFETILTGLYDVSSELAISGPVFNGTLFLCMKEEMLHSMVQKATGSASGPIENSMDFAGEILNIIAGHTKKRIPMEASFQIGSPSVIFGKEHVVATISQYKVIRILFDCEMGSFDINIFLDDLQANPDFTEVKPRFIFDENLFKPILASTERLLNETLGLNARKMGARMSPNFKSKFETSAIISIFSHDYQGKILFNVSDRLALTIYEALLMEKVPEIDESVKDALAETLNMITGNAKASFSAEGPSYALSIPYVIRGRSHIMTNAGHAPFITTLYNSNGGFFEICFTWIKRF